MRIKYLKVRVISGIMSVMIAVSAAWGASGHSSSGGTGNLLSLEQLQRDFTEWRFGMFLHYGIWTHAQAGWGTPRGKKGQTVDKFSPIGGYVDCQQWAAAAVSAGMQFVLLTTKHHDGFCLWDSDYTDFDVASSPYKKDVVRQYVDALRDHDLKVGLYYSMWDSTEGIDKGPFSEDQLAFVKGQLTELLSNYGKIDLLVFDGWFWKMGHNEIDYHEIRSLIRTLQPDCLVSDHTHLEALYHADFVNFEGPYKCEPKEGNILPGMLSELLVGSWFWSPKTPNKQCKPAEFIAEKIKKMESRYCNLILNCSPNQHGRLDDHAVKRLAEIGKAWSPNKATEGFQSTSVGPREEPSHPWRLDNLTIGNNDFCSTKHNIYTATLQNEEGFGLQAIAEGDQHSRCWMDEGKIRWLLASFSHAGSERFLQRLTNKDLQELKKGDSVRGITRFQLMD
jgi:alpha-L-fucosidase